MVLSDGDRDNGLAARSGDEGHVLQQGPLKMCQGGGSAPIRNNSRQRNADEWREESANRESDDIDNKIMRAEIVYGRVEKIGRGHGSCRKEAARLSGDGNKRVLLKRISGGRG